MARREDSVQAHATERDLTELKLPEDRQELPRKRRDVCRGKGSMLELLAVLFGMEQAARQQRASSDDCVRHDCPSKRQLPTTISSSLGRIPKATIMRLFD